MVEIAEVSGEALLRLLTDLLDLTKVEMGMLVIDHLPFNLHTVIRACANSLPAQNARERPRSRDFVRQPSPFGIVGDAARIRQIILNFLNNAVKFTEEGAVRITADSAPAGADHPVVRIAISDTEMGDTGRLTRTAVPEVYTSR